MTNKQSGFSLIEILIAVIILSVSALGLAKLNAIQQKNNVAAADRQYATRVAEGILEDIKKYARTRQTPPTTLNGITLSGSSTNLTGSSSNRTSAFAVNVLYSAAPDWIDTVEAPGATTTDDTLAFKAQVNVSWTSADGQTQNVLLVNDIYQLKSAETAAPTRPTTICKWDSGPTVWPQGAWIVDQTVNPGPGTEKVFMCTKAGGCALSTGKPSEQPTLWKDMGVFPYPGGTVKNGIKCAPPLSNGAPSP